MTGTNRLSGIFALAAALLGTPALAQVGGSGVTDFTATRASAVEVGDLVEALSVGRGTRVRPTAPPTVLVPIYFEFDSATPLPESLEWLAKLGDALASPDLGSFRFSIEGHTDDVGSDGYNQVLSERRAAAVRGFLRARGVSAERLSSIGKGERDPVDSNASEGGRRRNRRVEVTNLGSATAS
jgi:outer membrane protein OmpA-like peptidoglycan-associated protein